MTVKEFFGAMDDCRWWNIELYDISSNLALKTKTDELNNESEDWKNAEIDCWCMDKDRRTFIIDVYR